MTLPTEVDLQLVLGGAVDQADITAMLASSPLTTTSSGSNLLLVVLPSHVILIDNLGGESQVADFTLDFSTIQPSNSNFCTT